MLSEQNTLQADTMLKIERERLLFSKDLSMLTIRAQDYHLFLLKLLNIIATGDNHIESITNPLDNILKYYDYGCTLYDYFNGEISYCNHRQLVSHHFNTLRMEHKHRHRLNRDLQICVGISLIEDHI